MKRAWLGILICCWFWPLSAIGAEDPAQWVGSAIGEAKELGIFDPSETENYERKVTKQEFVQFLVTMLEKQIPDEYKVKGRLYQNYFADTNNAYVLRAAEYGIVSGAISANQNPIFQPNKEINRTEAAVMLRQTITYWEMVSQRQLPINSNQIPMFEDGVPPWATEAVNWLSMNGIMVGSEGRFRPNDLITLEESLSIMTRAAGFVLEYPYNVQVNYVPYQSFLTRVGSAQQLNYGTLKEEFFFPRKDGGYTVVTNKGTSRELVVTIFNQDFRLVSQKRIVTELPIIAEIYLSQDGCFYVLMGQENLSEDPAVEVIRVVKYGANWEQLDSITILAGACITRTPFLGGTPDMTDDGTTLVIHTTRERFVKPEDGINHQSNLTLKINMADMSLTYISPPFPENHVSHSFRQFVAFQGSDVIYFDHGDGYPRALYFQKETPGSMQQNIGQPLPGVKVYPLIGSIGDNYTGVTPGGFVQGPNGILGVANATVQTEQEVHSTTRNILLLRSNNSLEEASSQWLTNYPAGSRTTVGVPYLIKTGDDRYVVIWNTFISQSYASTDYVMVDSQGNTLSKLQKLYQVPLGETAPLYQDGKLVWFLGKPKFSVYRIAI